MCCESRRTESFEIESVPTIILLRGHTLIQRVSGADAQALTAAVAKFASAPAGDVQPQSKTDGVPQAAAPQGETPAELETRMHSLMNQSKVVLFMKGVPDEPRCGSSRKIVGLLRDQEVEFGSFDISKDDGIRQGLKTLNNWPTFPQLIINGELAGGLDIVQEMVENGELKEVIGA
ncbi:hypothetical protein D9758_016667 [Tetrapyrgos nigripes]|uniref:Glutaredoxin domain-containing protein n=1 Tax=Tetrapyrgos nigripes TaxID=182062 RepID=A0A8H5C9E7_9AGAR|nr:hypothetical protein D9758_016667 [Tetrapyrgos nigripes]